MKLSYIRCVIGWFYIVTNGLVLPLRYSVRESSYQHIRPAHNNETGWGFDVDGYKTIILTFDLFVAGAAGCTADRLQTGKARL